MSLLLANERITTPWVMRDLGMTGLNLGTSNQDGLGSLSGSPILVQVDNTQVLS